jgi:hypothetical protein
MFRKKSGLVMALLVLGLFLTACTRQDAIFGKAIDTPTGCVEISPLEIWNDRAVARNNELAFSGVPIAKNSNLRSSQDLQQLYVINSAGNSVPAQFDVLSRWSAGPSDSSAEVQWLQVAIKANVNSAPANGKVMSEYSLVRCTSGSPGTAMVDGQLTATSSGNLININTAVAQFTIDSTNPSIITDITYGGNNVYDVTNSGPSVIVSGNELSSRVESCVIEENGNVKTTVLCRGHFIGGASPCPAMTSDNLGYTSRLTFVRNSADVLMEFSIVNECGEGGRQDLNFRAQIDEVSWDFSFNGVTERRVFSDSQTYSGNIARVAQLLDRTGRQAEVRVDGTVTETSAAFEKPMAALRTANVIPTIQLAMMRFREPQALEANGNTLSIKFLSQPRIFGEAQGVWNFAKLSLNDASTTNVALQTLQNDILKIERGLLVHTPASYINAVEVMPPLPSSTNANLPGYLAILNNMHDGTINGQWQRTKNYDIFTWPDIEQFPDRVNLASWDQFDARSNYWSPTSTELKQWFVDGDPKWVYDFAWWLENTLHTTITYNLGSRQDNGGDLAVSGLGVGDGRVTDGFQAEGNRYRNTGSSFDYFYNQGSDEAYLIRPSGALLDNFVRAGATMVDRYVANGRSQFVNERVMGRQTMQHVNMLKYASRFTKNPTIQAGYQNKLTEIMTEFATENLAGGMLCEGENINTQCQTDQSFMIAALHYSVFTDYLINWGDINGVIKTALVNYAREYFQKNIPGSATGNIDVGGDWGTFIQCTFQPSLNCQRFREPDLENALFNEKSADTGVMMIGHWLDPSINICEPLSGILDDFVDPNNGIDPFNGAGWIKDNSQAMREFVHALGVSESCTTGVSSQPAVCGDRIVQTSEQCDLGAANGACPATCSAGCTTNTCAGGSGQVRIPGDVTGTGNQPDGTLDIRDVLAVIDHIVGTTPFLDGSSALLNSDFNSDGQRNILDVLGIINSIINPVQANRAPVLAPIGAQSGVVGTELTFQVSATDMDGDTLNFAATGLPAGATFDAVTRTFTFMPAAVGSFSVTFTVSDSQATDFELVLITISAASQQVANRNPIFVNVPAQAVDFNQPIVFDVVVSDADGDAATVIMDFSALANFINPGDITLTDGTAGAGEAYRGRFNFNTVTAGPGSDPVVFTANDGRGGTVTMSVQLTVRPQGDTGGQQGGGQQGGGQQGGGQAAATMSFFVTSRRVENPIGTAVRGGNFGGLAGADAFCNALGVEAGSARTWRAYLSTAGANARDRIGTGPWFNSEGTLVANNVNELHDTSWTTPILTEGGQNVEFERHDVVTGSTRQGRNFVNQAAELNRVYTEWPGSPYTDLVDNTPYCNDWTFTGPNQNPGDVTEVTVVGHTDDVRGIVDNPGQDDNYWNSDHVTSCHEINMAADLGDIRIFCFAIN